MESQERRWYKMSFSARDISELRYLDQVLDEDRNRCAPALERGEPIGDRALRIGISIDGPEIPVNLSLDAMWIVEEGLAHGISRLSEGFMFRPIFVSDSRDRYCLVDAPVIYGVIDEKDQHMVWDGDEVIVSMYLLQDVPQSVGVFRRSATTTWLIVSSAVKALIEDAGPSCIRFSPLINRFG